MQAEQQDWYRMHYCGTCKSIGRLYGQRSRVLLNFDCVFLAELLSLIQEENTENWDAKLSSHSCFAMPDEAALPLSLQYAADMNLILADMKLKDNLQDDSVKFVWQSAQRLFKKPFNKIQDRLSDWDIDTRVLLEHQMEDARREDATGEETDIHKLLAWHAAPSAAITAYLFAKGADAVQKPAWRESMSKIGSAFGELVYGLDAWRDVENDELNEEFNLLLVDPERSIEASKESAAEWLWQKAESIKAIIQEASFPTEVKSSLTSRLMLNLATALGDAPHVCTPQSGIEKATVPTIARTIGGVQKRVAYWTNPLKPARFAATYIAFLLVAFHQHLFAAANLGAESSFSLDYGLLAALVAAPVGVYFAAKTISKNRSRIAIGASRFQRKLKKRIQRLEQKARNADDSPKWFLWIFLGLGALVLLVLILLVVAAASCGNNCECAPDCGCDCNSGNSCGGCDNCCDCDCNSNCC